ncbi:cytochrome b [Ghiorsea bivora]|uniref:cytochrome b n=1 Tax=Ghiorsea bivora TaxID=1485545 RepID=UPI001E4A61D3|nr:cytochrome b [Ghiorsea bivora]
MQLRNTKTAYGWVTIVLHWLMALLVFAMFGLGLYMVDLTYVDAWYKAAPALHISVGVILMLLLTFRLVWRLSNPAPEVYGQAFEKVVGLLVHRLHYVFMFVLMLSGYLMVTADGRGIAVFTWFEVPALWDIEQASAVLLGKMHMTLAWAFMGFVVLHTAAALKHHWLDQDRTLLRMLGIKDNQ